MVRSTFASGEGMSALQTRCWATAVAVIVNIGWGGVAAAATLNVPGDFATIQACIDAAVSGVDGCVVAPGTYHGQDRIERERRAQHDLVAQCVIEQCRVVLVNEPVDLLIGNEDQHVVHRPGRRVDVFAGRDFPDLLTHVLQELTRSLRAARVAKRTARILQSSRGTIPGGAKLIGRE